jgi:hypothetical protein
MLTKYNKTLSLQHFHGIKFNSPVGGAICALNRSLSAFVASVLEQAKINNKTLRDVPAPRANQ